MLKKTNKLNSNSIKMKKILKLKRISQKSKKCKKCLSKKKYSRKMLLQKKIFLKQIESPHNTNDFLMNNQSSPFLIEDDDSLMIKPSYIIAFEDDANSELDLFSIKELESTNEESMMVNEKSFVEKEQKEKY